MNVLLTIFSGLVAVAGPSFVSVANDHGVQVFEHRGAPSVEMMAIGVVDAPPADVMAVLLDYDNYTRLNPRLSETKVLARSDNDLTVYQRLKLPVIKDREYIIHVSWRAGDKCSIRFGLAPNPKPENDLVQMPVLAGRWELEPINGGTGTRAVYYVQMALGEGVPNSLVADGAVKEIPMLFKALREVLAAHHAELALHRN